MVFLSLLAIGVLAGLALAARPTSSLGPIDAAYSGATGSFLLGAAAVAAAERTVAAHDPLVLAAGLLGAVGGVLLVEALARRLPPGAARRRGRRPG